MASAAANAFAINEIARDCYREYVVGAKLGEGEQGIAYAANGPAGQRGVVMKKSKFVNADSLKKWKEEVRISYELGREGIGPIIHKAWLCPDADGTMHGYIIMERMAGDLRGYRFDTGVVGQKLNGRNIDHLNNCPISVQQDYVRLLEKMIDKGFIHMDNHPGNLGVVERGGMPQGILFDFGFTQRRADLSTPNAKLKALGFSIAQIIEHMPIDERVTNYFFKIFVAIENGTYVLGDYANPAYTEEGAVDLPAAYNIQTARWSALKAAADDHPDVPKDIYVGFYMYCYLLKMPVAIMYNKSNYGHVYEIRTKTAKMGGRRKARKTVKKTRRNRK